MKFAHRFSGPGQPYEGLTKITHGGPVWTGDILGVPEQLDVPLRWRKPRRIFVDSMSDLFHENGSAGFIAQVFWAMWRARHHTFQILTKRPAHMLAVFDEKTFDGGIFWEVLADLEEAGDEEEMPWPLPNVWLGVSVEDQARADERIPLLAKVPAVVRFLSCEPLLGPLDLQPFVGPPRPGKPCLAELDVRHDRIRPSIHWVIVGGESGPDARACEVDWIRDVVSQCRATRVPTFVKQLGARPTLTEAVLAEWGDGVRFTGDGPGTNRGRALLADPKGGDPLEWPEALRVREFPACG
jgi:protein gp37